MNVDEDSDEDNKAGTQGTTEGESKNEMPKREHKTPTYLNDYVTK